METRWFVWQVSFVQLAEKKGNISRLESVPLNHVGVLKGKIFHPLEKKGRFVGIWDVIPSHVASLL